MGLTERHDQPEVCGEWMTRAWLRLKLLLESNDSSLDVAA
jgi:hypothetical protein